MESAAAENLRPFRQLMKNCLFCHARESAYAFAEMMLQPIRDLFRTLLEFRRLNSKN
jgi:hypothetical protein